jgi:putative ABC transport system permease protein
MFSVLAESLTLALIGATIGALFAWSAFSGSLTAMGGAAVILLVTPGMAAGGVVFALVLAAVAGFFPAVRAARQPIATALRAT